MADDRGALERQELAELEELEALEAKAAGAEAPVEGAERAPLSNIEAGIINATQTGTFGFADEIVGGLRTATDTLNPLNKDATLQNVGETYDKNVTDERAMLAQARQENPVSSIIGGVAGGMATGKIGHSVMKGAGLLTEGGGALGTAGRALFNPAGGIVRKGIVGGAANGAAQGFGEGEGDVLERAKHGSKMAAWGGAVGLVFGTGAKLGGKAVNSVTKYFDPDALEEAAVGASRTDMKKGDGQGTVSWAVKKFNELAGFAPEPDGSLPTAAILQQRAEDLLSTGADDVQKILEQVDDKAARSTMKNFDVSDIKAMADDVRTNPVNSRQLSAADKIDESLAMFERKMDQYADDGISVLELQEYKQVLQGQIDEMNGFAPGEVPTKYVESLRSLADKLKTRIEDVTDAALPRSQRGALKAANDAQSVALTLRPALASKVAAERANGIKAPSSFDNVVRFGANALGMGDSSADQLGRAGLARSAQSIMQMLPQIEKMNGPMAAHVKQILKLPPNKIGAAIAPLVGTFSEFFEPSVYPSLFEGKIYDPADIESHREYIMQNVPSVSERAKQLSALNKDGTVAALPEQ